MKDKIDKLVDIYLDHLMSSDSDAGWHNAGMWQAAMESIRSTAGDKDLRMIAELRYIRGQHKLLPMAVSALFRGIRDAKHREALLAHRYYEGKVDSDGRVMTDKRVAALLGVTEGQYKQRKQLAYEKMETAVIMLTEYDHNKRNMSEVA